MSNPRIYVVIEASYGWDFPTEDDGEKDIRHQQQHDLNAMALDLNSIVKDILEKMIFHRKRIDV